MQTHAYIGRTIRLPDGPSGTITAIQPGHEYGDPIYYITVRSSIGHCTRWIYRHELPLRVSK